MLKSQENSVLPDSFDYILHLTKNFLWRGADTDYFLLLICWKWKVAVQLFVGTTQEDNKDSWDYYLILLLLSPLFAENVPLKL